MTDTPIRTFSMQHPIAGYIEFSVPVMNPDDVNVYLHKKLSPLSEVDRFILTNKLMKIATDMWDSYALWISDPDAARLELRNDPDIAAWMSAE